MSMMGDPMVVAAEQARRHEGLNHAEHLFEVLRQRELDDRLARRDVVVWRRRRARNRRTGRGTIA